MSRKGLKPYKLSQLLETSRKILKPLAPDLVLKEYEVMMGGAVEKLSLLMDADYWLYVLDEGKTIVHTKMHDTEGAKARMDELMSGPHPIEVMDEIDVRLTPVITVDTSVESEFHALKAAEIEKHTGILQQNLRGHLKRMEREGFVVELRKKRWAVH